MSAVQRLERQGWKVVDYASAPSTASLRLAERSQVEPEAKISSSPAQQTAGRIKYPEGIGGVGRCARPPNRLFAPTDSLG